MRQFIGELIRGGGHLQYNFDLEAEIGHGLPPEEVARFLAEPRPRNLSRRVFNALFIGSSGIRIPFWAKAAYIIILLGMSTGAVIGFPWERLPGLMVKLGLTETAQGRVTAYERRKGYVLNKDGSRREVLLDSHTVFLRFADAEGRPVETYCMLGGKGSSPGRFLEYAREGTPVTIRYSSRDPRAALLSGTMLRESQRIGFVDFLITVIFLFFATILFSGLAYWLGRRRRFRAVLADGEPGLAEIRDIRESGFHINGQYVHKLFLRIETEGGTVDSVFKTRGPRLDYLRRCQNEGRRLVVLFLPESPNRLALLGAGGPVDRPGL